MTTFWFLQFSFPRRLSGVLCFWHFKKNSVGTPSSNLCTLDQLNNLRIERSVLPQKLLLSPTLIWLYFCQTSFFAFLYFCQSGYLHCCQSLFLYCCQSSYLYCCLSAQLSKCIAVYLHCCQSVHFLPTCPLSLPILLSANLPNCQLDFCNLEICWTSTHLKNPSFLVAIWIPLANFPFNLNILVNRRY